MAEALRLGDDMAVVGSQTGPLRGVVALKSSAIPTVNVTRDK
jgi:hypothetical protein